MRGWLHGSRAPPASYLPYFTPSIHHAFSFTYQMSFPFLYVMKIIAVKSYTPNWCSTLQASSPGCCASSTFYFSSSVITFLDILVFGEINDVVLGFLDIMVMVDACGEQMRCHSASLILCSHEHQCDN